MIPKIKRSVKKFLLNESGMVSKQSLLRMGVGLAMLTGSSIKASGAELTSESWSNSAVDGDSCSCTRTVSGSTWTDDWDRFKEFIFLSGGDSSSVGKYLSYTNSNLVVKSLITPSIVIPIFIVFLIDQIPPQ